MLGDYDKKSNLRSAIILFQELMSGYLFHTKNMSEEAKCCFKYFYTVIKSDYNINNDVLILLQKIGYENDLDISCNMDYSYTLASFTIKSLKKQVKKLKKE